MKPDWEQLELSPAERELEQALGALAPAESGLERGAVFADKIVASPVSPLGLGLPSGRSFLAGVAGGSIVASVLLVVLLLNVLRPSAPDDPQPGPRQIANPPVDEPNIPQDEQVVDAPAPGPRYVEMASARIRLIGEPRYEILDPGRIRLEEGELFVSVERTGEPLVIETPAGTATTQASQSYIRAQLAAVEDVGNRQDPSVDPSDPNPPGVGPMSTFRALTAVMILSGMVELSNPLGQVSGGPGELLAAEEGGVPDKALPKTAIERLKPIIAKAIEDKAYPEAIKAIGQRIALEGQIQGDKPEEKIVRLEAEIAKAPQQMRPTMEAILAHWYWQYFQANRWRFMQRTATAEPPGDDILTWDLKRILAEIDRHFTIALAAEAELKKIPVGEYDALLTKGNVPDGYRPTLYDFLAFEAIGFYSAAEQAGSRAEYAFDLMADTPIFATADAFVAWELETADTQSPTVKAIRLHQDLLRLHKDDDDPAARLDADLGRLVFGYNKAFGEEKAARYKAALRRYVDRHGDHEISARARAYWAGVLKQEDDLVEAHRLAMQGKRAFPESFGGKMCHNLIEEIEAKSADVRIERVWCAPWPKIQVEYRNVEQVHFRAVKADWAARAKSGHHRSSQLSESQRGALLAKEPDLQWSAKLPATDDYQSRTEVLPTPEDLEPGFYFLLASSDPKFSGDDNVVRCSEFWVSDLALVMRTRSGQTELAGFVLEADSGEPIEGAEVQLWVRPGWQGGWQPGPKTKTDRNGLFAIEGTHQKNHLLLATHKGRQLATGNEYSVYSRPRQQDPYRRTVFFTDRSLYRPGQTVNYKGICIRVDQKSDNYATLPGENVKVVFHDHNGKEIARQQHRANDYGSFSGSFTAPRDRLTGRMSIRVDGEPQGQTAFNVEEYKRPKFQVTVDPPKTAPKLGGEVAMQGKATAYTGAAVDGAKVRWRVVREVRYPVWWSWRCWWRPRQTSSQEITRGTATTEPDGTFDVAFTAKPDLSVSEKAEPTFVYSVYADVTDTTGETRSAQQTTRVGYTALAASMAANSWLPKDKPVEILVTTTTLDGEGQSADCTLKVYRLIEPEKVGRATWSYGQSPAPGSRKADGRDAAPPPDPANPNSWELGEMAAERGLTTGSDGKASCKVKLSPGPYRAVLTTQDRFGKEVAAVQPLTVIDPDAKRFSMKIPYRVMGPRWSLEPGEEFIALWGSGYDRARAYVEIEHRGKLLQAFWTEPGVTQQIVKQTVTEAMRGSFRLRTTMVRENWAYTTSYHVGVPWTNKELTVAWEHFVSKLEPGQKETWTAVVSGPDAKQAVAEMVVALYDESLDAYRPHDWMSGFGVFRRDSSNLSTRFENPQRQLHRIHGKWIRYPRDATMNYRAFPVEIVAQLWGSRYWRKGRAGGGYGNRLQSESMLYSFALAEGKAGESESLRQGLDAASLANSDKGRGQAGAPAGVGLDLNNVTARKNLNETAFFFPHLVSNADGQVRIEFTMPEALTKWKFLGFAHDNRLRAGLLTDSVVTAKDLMVQPNPPRFLREGDMVEFTVKVSNQSPTVQKGSVRLTLADARTAKPIDAALGNTATDQSFEIAAEQSRSFSWKLRVPDGLGPIIYKTVGSTGRLSDGEEGMLPVLSRRVLVTESLPLPIRGPKTKDFAFDRLLKSGESDTLRHQTLTVEMVSNPSWYAVMALPYLMEYPHECSEQVFNRLYANALARHIAASDPKIRRVFDTWKAAGGDTLDSPLQKNQDLKAVLLEETPWVRQADNESQARKNVGILFDDNRLNDETARLLRKLAEMQHASGAWPWFPGGRPNDYITLYITTGFGRLRHLGVPIDTAPAVKSLSRLDGWIDKKYREILAHSDPKKNHLSSIIALYLYGRSFFLDDQAVDAKHQEAVDYFLGQARKYWFELNCRQSQAHLAVALKRFGNRDTAKLIVRSIKERSVTDDELGMFWRDTERSWWWYRAPIESQAMMIEAFDEVANDQEAVEECKVWLLKQKQTQDWKTTKATADAIYALLLRGSDMLASDALVEVALGGQAIKPEQVEAGTGYYRQRFVRSEIKPELGEIRLKKTDEGVAWGSVHWQYLEDMAKVTAHDGTPLKLEKALFVKRHTAAGPVLEKVAGPVAVGNELVVRVVLRTARAMEYVHLKDYRGSGTEPVNVLSRYKSRDGLYYYESTKDTASHFFIDYLPKGTYVFEYSVRVQLKGTYQTGFAQIQCMYAPEFNGHSESIVLEVK